MTASEEVAENGALMSAIVKMEASLDECKAWYLVPRSSLWVSKEEERNSGLSKQPPKEPQGHAPERLQNCCDIPCPCSTPDAVRLASSGSPRLGSSQGLQHRDQSCPQRSLESVNKRYIANAQIISCLVLGYRPICCSHRRCFCRSRSL